MKQINHRQTRAYPPAFGSRISYASWAIGDRIGRVDRNEHRFEIGRNGRALNERQRLKHLCGAGRRGPLEPVRLAGTKGNRKFLVQAHAFNGTEALAPTRSAGPSAFHAERL